MENSMTLYISRRLLQMIPLMIGISIIMFALIQAVPGGPEAMFLESGRFIDPTIIESYRHRLGLDQPLYIQYFKWLAAAVTGDFGLSFSTSRPVSEMILERLPATLELMLMAFVFAAIIAIPLGIFSAVRQYSLLDYLTTTLSFLGIAMPVFWFGLMLQLLFSVKLGWFPTSGRITVGDASLVDQVRHLVLPGIVLSLLYIAGWSRYMRASLLSVLRKDFMLTARAKGATERYVIWVHGVKNALIPVVSIMALDLAGLFSGAVITETVFAWPGIGRLFIQSVYSRDYPLVMGILMMGSFMVVFFNLVADVVYAWLDPRISYS
ncbi:MAG: ABC transporter permease [Anaerolineales bacterium]|nr:ABC transporter permease [Anaerolineales bacterium]